MLQLGNVISRHSIHFQSYADEIQFYTAMSPDDSGPTDALFNCILYIKLWMADHFPQLNQDKTEVLVIGSEAQRDKLGETLQALTLNPCQRGKNLGVIHDSDLVFEAHIRNTTKNAFYHLKKTASLSCQHRCFYYLQD